LKYALTIAALACAMSTAHAVQSSASGFAPFVGAGLTYGGDQVGDTIEYENSSSVSLHGGSLVDLRGGFEYQDPGSPWSFQMSLGYHVDKASARNGSVTFDRIPLEVLAHWDINESWRLGGGLRKALSPKVHTSGLGDGYAQEQSYSSTVGVVVEAETFFGAKSSVGLKIRAVTEKYKPELGGKEIDGTHLGVIGVYYFK
jgi:hypothetical protein